MGETSRILRRSVHWFLQNYQFCTSTAALLALPFSVSVLLSQGFIPSSSSPSSLLPTIYTRLGNLFDAAGFPVSSGLFTLLRLKLSQTISSSLLTLPFTLTFFLITKASIIQELNHTRPSYPACFISFFSIYKSLAFTYICNWIVIIAANATAFAILFFAFNCLEGYHFMSSPYSFLMMAIGAILYSVILANTLIVCNFALVLSGMERSGGFLAILKASVMLCGATSTALALTIPLNLALAATEALFQYRVMSVHLPDERQRFEVALEGLLIAYIYSILIVLDTTVSCIFFNKCKGHREMDFQDKYYCLINITDDNRSSRDNVKNPKPLLMSHL